MNNYLKENGAPLTKEEFIDKIKTDQAFADEFGDLGKVYGAAWRKWSGAEYTPCPDEKETVEQQW